MSRHFKRAESVPSRYTHRTDALAELIRKRPVAMAVVDCLGFVDDDGKGRMTKIGRDDPRRYDVRSFQHVAVYKFPVVSVNDKGMSLVAAEAQ